MKIAEYKSLTAQLQDLLQDIKNLEQPTGSLEREATTPMLVDADIRKTAAMMEDLQDDFSEDCKQADHPTIAALASTIAEFLEKTITKYYIPGAKPHTGADGKPKSEPSFHRFDIVRAKCEEWQRWIEYEAGRTASESFEKWIAPLEAAAKGYAKKIAGSDKYKAAVEDGRFEHPFKWTGAKAEFIRWLVYEFQDLPTKPTKGKKATGLPQIHWQCLDGLFECKGERLSGSDLRTLRAKNA